jgi:peptide chain release factor 2
LCNKENWDNFKKNKNLALEKKELEFKIKRYEKIYNDFADTEFFLEFLEKENDINYIDEIKKNMINIENDLNNFRTESLLGGEYDNSNVIMSLHSGAGGTESCDWVSILFRMYNKFCERKKFNLLIHDVLAGETVGIKSITFEIHGKNAYGNLKSECGIHRLIRLSPFDSANKRHTSFASVDVLPEIEIDDNLKVNDEELRVDTFRSSGAGGQHVNTTDSAVRITHLPTGIVVSCQNERSQKQNRDFALKVLHAKLLAQKIENQKNKIKNIGEKHKNIEFGSQIRTYVFHPYKLIKDHRTRLEKSNVDFIMDGNIDEFIINFLILKSKQD